MSANITTYRKVAFGTANPPVNALEWFGDLNFGKRGTVIVLEGVRGTRSRIVERTRDGLYTVGGVLQLQPCYLDLDTILPLIAGGTKSTNNIPFTELLPTFYVGIDKGAAQYLYSGCKTSVAVFSGSTGNPLSLQWGIEGLTETPGTISGLTALTPSVVTPYMFHDAVLTIASTSYEFRECQVSIDHHLILDRFMNSQSRTELPETDRTVTVALSLPYNSTTLALYDTGVTSAAVVLTWTNGSLFFKITLPAVQFPAQPPQMPARGEAMLPLVGVARKTGSTLEITFDNKSS